MGQEDTFRWALLVVVVITITIAGYYRIQARAAGGSVSRREEGLVLLAMRAVVGLSIWVAIIAYLVSPGSMAWSALPATDWLRWGGVVFGLLECGLLFWTLHHLGANLTDTVVTRAEATLIGGSLPTEAQWEFTARGTEGRTYPWGEEEPTCQRALYFGCDGRIPVMSLPDGTTPEGVHDLAGNVWEWVRDWYGYYESASVTDPEGPSAQEARQLFDRATLQPTGPSRLLRGGSIIDNSLNLRSWEREIPAFVPSGEYGFRVAWPGG